MTERINNTNKVTFYYDDIFGYEKLLQDFEDYRKSLNHIQSGVGSRAIYTHTDILDRSRARNVSFHRTKAGSIVGQTWEVY